MQHPNARLTPRGRRELVRLVEEGATLREAAAAYGVAVSTACVWTVRWRCGGRRAGLAGMPARSFEPPARVRGAARRARGALWRRGGRPAGGHG